MTDRIPNYYEICIVLNGQLYLYMIWMMGLRMLSDCDNCLRKHLAVKYYDVIPH